MEKLFLLRPDAGGIENARNTGNRIDHGREPKLIGNAEERQNAKARVDAMAKDARAQLDSEKDELAKTLAERLMGE